MGEVVGDGRHVVVGAGDQADGDPQVVVVGAHQERLAGRHADAARASATAAERSSATRIHRLMPSPPATAHAAVGEHVGRRAPAAGRTSPGPSAITSGVAGSLQQLEQHRLQDAARPARARAGAGWPRR